MDNASVLYFSLFEEIYQNKAMIIFAINWYHLKNLDKGPVMIITRSLVNNTLPDLETKDLKMEGNNFFICVLMFHVSSTSNHLINQSPGRDPFIL